MGGIQGCRVFKIEGVRALITDHKPDQCFDRGYACKVIGNFDEDTKRMRFEPLEDRFISTRPGHRKLQPQDAFDKLLLQRVFRVGLELRCPPLRASLLATTRRSQDGCRVRLLQYHV